MSDDNLLRLVVLPMPGEIRYVLMGLPVNVNEQVDWIELLTAEATVARKVRPE